MVQDEQLRWGIGNSEELSSARFGKVAAQSFQFCQRGGAQDLPKFDNIHISKREKNE